MSHQGAVPMYNGSYVQPGYGQGAMNPYMQQQQVMQQAQQQQMYQQQQQQQAMQQQQQQMMQLQQRYQQDLQRGAVPIVNGRPLDFSSYVGYLQQQQGQQQQGQQQQGYPQGGVYGGAQQGYPQGGVYGGAQQPNPYGMPQQHNPYQSSNMSSVYNQPSRVGYGNPQQAFGPMVARDTTTGVESAPSRFSGGPKAQQPQVQQQQQVQTQVPQHHQPYQQQPQQVSGAEHVEHNRYSSIPQGATTYREAPKPTHEIAVASDKPVEKIKLKRVGKVKMKYLGKLPYGNENVGITGNVPTPRDQFEELGVITTDRYGAIREAVFPEDTKGFTTIARVESPIVTLPVSFFMSGVFSNASSFHENLKNLVVLSDDLDSLVYARELDKLVTASINDVVKVDYDVTIDSFIDDYADLIKHVAHNKQLDSEHVVKAKLETILENNYCRAYREEVEEIKAEEDFELNEDGAIIEVEEFDRRESIGVMEQGICVHVDHYSDLLGLNMKDVQAKEGELLDISSEPSYFKVLLTQAEGINMRTFGMGASITSFMVVAKDAVVLKFVRSKEGEWFVSRPQSLLI